MPGRARYVFGRCFFYFLVLIFYAPEAFATDLEPANLLSWQTTASELRVQLTSPEIKTGEKGSVTAPETAPDTIAGNPELPVQYLKFTLPPNTDLKSLEILVISSTTYEFPKPFEVRPAPPLVQYREPQISEGKAVILEKNPEVYERSFFYPAPPILINNSGRLGPYPYVTLKFYPFQYNPVIRKLRRIERLNAKINFRTFIKPLSLPNQAATSSSLNDLASKKFLNFSQVYPTISETRKMLNFLKQKAGYCVITTNAIAQDCSAIEAFLQHKTTIGFNTHLVTEDHYGSYSGDRAAQVRRWLIDNYIPLNLKYVLLIGDPHPLTGDMPMRLTRPRCADTGSIKYADPDYERDVPSDFYYADLTGNWDKDGDGSYGEGVIIQNSMPDSEMPPTSFSVRWTGEYVPSTDGTRRFYLISQGASALYIGDMNNPLINAEDPGFNISYASKDFSAGSYPMRVEYTQPQKDGYIVIWYDDDDDNWYYRMQTQYLRHFNGQEYSEGLWVEYFDEPDFTSPLTSHAQTASFRYTWWQGDFGPGGPDSEPEVFIGRIPVYNSDHASLEKILQKTINYELQLYYSNEDRKTALLAMEPLDDSTPGYHLGEQIRENFLIPRGYMSTRVYKSDYGITPPPEYTPCNYDNVLAGWQGGMGLVVWLTHGDISYAVNIFSASKCYLLDDSRPALTFQVSCLNGKPEYSTNLGVELLRQGSVGTVSASREGWYTSGQTDFTSYHSNASMAYHYVDHITEGWTTGESLFEVRGNPGMWSMSSQQTSLTNALVHNLYGDPSLRLLSAFTFIGDLDGSGVVDLVDAIQALRLLAGFPSDNITPDSEVNGDGKIGIAELNYILQKISGWRDN